MGISQQQQYYKIKERSGFARAFFITRVSSHAPFYSITAIPYGMNNERNITGSINVKKNLFLIFFITTNVGFFFLQIKKQMLFIKESFRKQKNERVLAMKEQEQQKLMNQLYTTQNKADIKQYAHHTLHMKPVQLTQVKKLDHDQQ